MTNEGGGIESQVIELSSKLGNIGTIIFLLCVAIGTLIVYFIPSMIAHYRRHNNMLAIFMLNLFLGWLCVGWIISMVWACTNNVATPPTSGKGSGAYDVNNPFSQ